MRASETPAVVHDARAARGGVDADVGDAGQQAERPLDQPAAGRAAHAVDQHDRFAPAVVALPHEVARELRPLEAAALFARIVEVGRAAAEPVRSR